MSTEQHLLTDSQMHDFIVNGFITVKTDLSNEFHEEVYARTKEVFDKEGNPGNNLLPRIPMIDRVFEDPKVAGTLTSVLGPDYYMQPHRHCHRNMPGSKGQRMHQDGGKRWSHKTRRLLVFYYPQDTPVERGPTGVVPGSHYYKTADGATIRDVLPLTGQAGDVTIANYDLWHQAMPNSTDHERFMMKFLYLRMSEPTEPTWQHEQADWDEVATASDGIYRNDDLRDMYASIWNWHLGNKDQEKERDYCEESVGALIEALKAEPEVQCLQNVYALSRFGEPAVVDLANLLADESEDVRRYGFYGLSTIGSAAVPALAKLMDHENEAVRKCAVETLGDIGTGAGIALPNAIPAVSDASSEVRAKAAESIGTIATNSENDVHGAASALSLAIRDEDTSVRRLATLAMCRLAPQNDALVPVLQAAFGDENRTVRGDAVHALRRINTPMAKDVLLDYLITSRWCPLTSPESTH